MTWPNSTCAELETIIRTYLNESTASFYTQTEIYRWLSLAAENISLKTFCTRRILNVCTNANERFVGVNALKIFFVEYVPSIGRSIMLGQIDPLKLGNSRVKGNNPQFWYEYGNGVHIEPVPNSNYNLRIYVADKAKVTKDVSSFTIGAGADEWTAGTGWSVGNPAVHTGNSSNFTYNTAFNEGSEYTIEFFISDVGVGGAVTPYIGVMAGTTITSSGHSTQTIIAVENNPEFKFTAVNDITIDDLRGFKKVGLETASDQTELSFGFHHNMVLSTLSSCLRKNRQFGPATMVESISNNELLYLKQNIVDIIPNGRLSMAYK